MREFSCQFFKSFLLPWFVWTICDEFLFMWKCCILNFHWGFNGIVNVGKPLKVYSFPLISLRGMCEYLYECGVVWHTGKSSRLRCSRSPVQTPAGPGGILQGLFCSESGWHTTPVARRVGLVLEHFPFTNAASQWLYVNLVCRFHTRLCRLSPGTPVSSYT